MSGRRDRALPKRRRPRPPALPEAAPPEPGRTTAPGAASDRRREIHDLIELLKQHNLAELEVEHGGFRVRLVREATATVPQTATRERPPGGAELPAASQIPLPVKEATGLVTVTSPIVGTFYRSPSPDADPYVEEGDFVKKGQVLCIVEAMKLMNEIEAEVDGRIVKILAESTKPVEYGQPLFLIEPLPAS
ncbi:acetyl-CoA carboxylase biotin carboxyl carrier protein [Nitrospira sp. Kam-Ns4a]